MKRKRTVFVKSQGHLSKLELEQIVGNIRTILWPGGDVDHEWTPETLDAIARVLYLAGLRDTKEVDE